MPVMITVIVIVLHVYYDGSGSGSGDNYDFHHTGPISVDTMATACSLDLLLHIPTLALFISVKENELRQLRKTATEYEEQNAILSKHIEGMKQSIEKIHVESNTQRTTNDILQQHLESLRAVLTLGFNDLQLPSTGELPSDDCIDNYMTKLYALILDSPQENEGLITSVRDIVSRMCLQK